MQRFKQITDDIVEVNKKLESLKKEFAEVIVDKSIPLEDRWQFWRGSDDKLKNTESWNVYFETIDTEKVMYDMYASRHETITSERIKENIEDGDKTEEALIAFQEEVLERNLYSFCFDW
jgi:hypothetical protein